MATMIRITRGYENLGEFSEDEVRSGLREGRFLSTDHGWSEGMAASRALSEWSQFAAESPPTQSSPVPDAMPPSPAALPVQTEAASQIPAAFRNDPARRIEIFEPFGAAYEVMKRVLFRPFDLKRWFIIGFAAFISGAWGGGFGFGQLGRISEWRKRTSFDHGAGATEQIPAWVWPLAVGVGIVVFLLIFVIWWIVARGKFVFTDCIVRNRAAIADPWREYRREGNSYFLFILAVGFVLLIVFGGSLMATLIPMGVFAGVHRDFGGGPGASMIFILVSVGLIWLAASLYLNLVTAFMVPVMYRRRCTALEAFKDVGGLILHRPAPFILLLLFAIVLFVALGIVGTIVACATCCIGALPYVSTVLLLPAFVWLRAFLLCFIRQFGPEYDVWENMVRTEPPPLQGPPGSMLESPPLSA